MTEYDAEDAYDIGYLDGYEGRQADPRWEGDPDYEDGYAAGYRELHGD